MKHSYWIPTNRDIKKCLESYLEEIEYCQKKYQMNIPVFILDSGNEKCEKNNLETIIKLRKERPEVVIYYIPFEVQKKLIGHILEVSGLSKEKYQDCFIPERVNYGAVMNKIYLLAAALQYDVIHRRDSDTVLQENCPYPLEIEIENIGKINSNFDSDRKVAIVGSGYVGEWNLDIKEFVIGNNALFCTFLSCLNIPDEGHEDFMKETYEDCEKYFKEDVFQYVMGEETKMPEAGNFSIYRIFKDFPCLPADYTLGSDYFTFKMAIALEYPVIFHERRVFHTYHEGRKSAENMQCYIKSLSKFCDHSPVYWYFVNQVALPLMQEKKNKGTEFSNWDMKSILNKFGNGIIDLEDVVIETRKDNLQRFAREFLSVKYPKEAEQIEQDVDSIIKECKADYVLHGELLKSWKQVIFAAEGENKFVEEVCNECK